MEALRYWKKAEPATYGQKNIYLFIDYISLPQFRRSTKEQEDFEHAMQHMHLFYATLTGNRNHFASTPTWSV